MKNTVKEFKDFITTGNLIGVAIGILMGVQVGVLVKSFTDNLINPIFAVFGGKPDFRDSLVITINETHFRFGSFLTDALNFVIVGFVAFILIKIATKIFPPKPAGESEIEVLKEIRDSLKK